MKQVQFKFLLELSSFCIIIRNLNVINVEMSLDEIRFQRLSFVSKFIGTPC